MKTKRKKKRYHTANEIRDKIAEYKQKAIRAQQLAESLDIKADEYARYPEMREDSIWNREQAKKMRRKANRIQDVTLVHLKEKLAEWQTELLPGIGDPLDRSVQA